MKKRADGRYQISVVVGIGERGKPKRKFVYGRTIREVEEKAAELRQQAAKGIILDKNITLEELAHLWLSLEKQPELKKQSYGNLCSQVRKMVQYLGAVRVRDLSAAHIDSVKADLMELEQYDSYNKMLSNLRAILDFGIRHDYVARNVTAGMKRIKDPNKAAKRALTPFELRAIEQADLAPIDRLFVDILRYSGMRRGEALALQISDIDLLRHEVRIDKMLVSSTNTIEDGSKTAAGTRVVPLPQVFFDRNETYIRSRKPYEPLYMSSVYKPISTGTFWRRWKDITAAIFGDQAPEDFTPHLFRHNYASELYASGLMKADIKAAQYVLGHADLKTTMDVYTHFDRNRLDRSMIDAFYAHDVNLMSEQKKKPQKMA